MKTGRSLLVFSLALVILLGACRPQLQVHDTVKPPAESKVLVIAVSAITWDDLARVSNPEFRSLLARSLIANASVRVSNNPADAFATLGAGQRANTDLSAAWNFNVLERIESGVAQDLFRRRNDSYASGNVVVTALDELIKNNRAASYDARIGSLGYELAAVDGTAAIIGNADFQFGPLPSLLPSEQSILEKTSPDTGIHREAALAVMDVAGAIPIGDVSRHVLSPSPNAPFGISTDPQTLLAEFREAWKSANLVMVETGDTYRADAYWLGYPSEKRREKRVAVLDRVLTSQVLPMISEVDLSKDLVIMFSAVTPGGTKSRGQLRPVLLLGGGIEAGIATSSSTKRPGLVTVPDLTVTIAHQLNLPSESFGAGHQIAATSSSPNPKFLVTMNDRAVVHDKIRIPLSVAYILIQVFTYAWALITLSRKGALRPWSIFLLLSTLSFPIASYTTRYVFWQWGTWAAGCLVVAETILIAAAASVIFKGKAVRAATALLVLTLTFFIVDLITGSQSQLDSVLGYTSVAAGRFYGIGNLGFSIIAAAALIIASRLAEKGARLVALGLLGITILLIGLPQFGEDNGGLLTMFMASVIFAFVLYRKRSFPLRLLPWLLAGGVVLFLAAAGLDLLRPAAERTHAGEFLAAALAHPSFIWLVARRKLGVAGSLAFSSRWGLVIPFAVAAFVWLYKRQKTMFESRPAVRATLESLIAGAILGSLLNDSGVAVAAVFLGVGVPWALLVTDSVSTTT